VQIFDTRSVKGDETMERYVTIGMAGHIDHGKTTLTKALTGVDTDRLQEEKERNISIEPGFALLFKEDELEVALIDVPGHERFIRQMIAGVAGIDAVVLVIASDEGVMPQTKEHLHILSLLGVKHGMIVLTKMDQAEEELIDIVRDDVVQTVRGTFLEDASIFYVDSARGKGIVEVKEALRSLAQRVERLDVQRSFRLPIDQAFTVKGQGVVVRGTVFDGVVFEGDELILLPGNHRVRVRQLQRHQQRVEKAEKGQRAALNITGVAREAIKRGNVLVKDSFYNATLRIDVELTLLNDVQFHLKQRQVIKCYVGTSEVMGRIIFFDRNEWKRGDEPTILCQLELDEDVVATRGDRFIIRRPSPVETIGGGWVIDANAAKYRFGKKTIKRLAEKREGTPEARVANILHEHIVLTKEGIEQRAAITDEEFHDMKHILVAIHSDTYTLATIFERVASDVFSIVTTYHDTHPLRVGIDIATVRSQLRTYPEHLIDAVVEKLILEDRVIRKNEYIAEADFHPSPPSKWKKRFSELEADLHNEQMDVKKWSELVKKHDIPKQYQTDFYHYLLETKKAYILDDDRIVSKIAVERAYHKLLKDTNRQRFTLQQARESLQLTRKNLVPLLELFDHLRYTKRVENERYWLEQ